MAESRLVPSSSKRTTVIEKLRATRNEGGDIGIENAALPFPAKEIGLTGMEDPVTRALKVAGYCMKRSGYTTLRPMLPAMLKLKGQPYSINDYFPFEPLFRTDQPSKQLWMCGRQLSKSTSHAAEGVLKATFIPYFSTLFVTPLYEMIRRFSHNYVREFIENSPLKRMMLGDHSASNVLQRSFANGSVLHFSFAFLDAERTRGIAADKMVIDEVQHINSEFIPIIRETMSGSPWGIEQYSGTPLSLDNTIERLWQDSSQAEFMVKCHHGGCGHWNVPRSTHDLREMIGNYHDDIGPTSPGVVCRKCTFPLDPRRMGRWVHAYSERVGDFNGYHVPQIVMPLHYENPKKWAILLGKQRGASGTTENVFMNEVCGESWDTGSKLVTLTDLKNACVLPWKNTVDEAEKHLSQYQYRILGVDWGGGGGRLKGSSNKKGQEMRERTSFTTLAVCGIRPDGKVDCLWGYRSQHTHDHFYEARLILAALARFRCSHFAHDYNGAGASREVLVRQAGFPIDNILPITYHPSAKKAIMHHHEPVDDHPRHWWSVDKGRSLVLMCDLIKHGRLRFFEYDHQNADEPGLVHDFLALIEEKIHRPLGADVYQITKNPNLTDDFAHAVNLATCSLFNLRGAWPDLSVTLKFYMPRELVEYVHPLSHKYWDDLLS